MKLRKNHRCNGCQHETQIEFIKPAVFAPSITSYKCPNCQSTFVLKVIKQKNSDYSKTNYECEFHVIRYQASGKLKSLQMAKRLQNPYDKMG